MEKRSFVDKVTPSDVVAFLIIVGGMIIHAKANSPTIGNMLTAVTFYYFGKKVPTD